MRNQLFERKDFIYYQNKIEDISFIKSELLILLLLISSTIWIVAYLSGFNGIFTFSTTQIVVFFIYSNLTWQEEKKYSDAKRTLYMIIKEEEKLYQELHNNYYDSEKRTHENEWKIKIIRDLTENINSRNYSPKTEKLMYEILRMIISKNY